jgi:hypothetical protein
MLYYAMMVSVEMTINQLGFIKVLIVTDSHLQNGPENLRMASFQALSLCLHIAHLTSIAISAVSLHVSTVQTVECSLCVAVKTK